MHLDSREQLAVKTEVARDALVRLAQRTGAELHDGHAFRRLVELEPTSGWAHTALGLTLDRQSRHREGAVMHRLASAMGESARDETRVDLVERSPGVEGIVP